ncbi:MAG: hypothetical protein CVV25_00630 [Ignavibacteriae bacterium HGW-Ignavibacteriae-4]|jgi:hypothetical protein|nr:MAG: hypothetical protein CVV25_00630 [Ignavibacteriae bacterium HGW-Ignavibacteriae-4]
MIKNSINIAYRIIISLFLLFIITSCYRLPNRIESVKEVNKIKIEILNEILSILEENGDIDCSDYTKLYVYPYYTYILDEQIDSKFVTINRLVPIDQMKDDYENSIMISDLNIYVDDENLIAASIVLLQRKKSIDYYYLLNLDFKDNVWVKTKYIKNEEPIKHFFK